ncbi:MAG: FUN14 domain-containing protein [Candidatus Bathyarchaeia archaeon]
MSELISPLVYQLGIGGIGGFIVGFALKKLSKLIIILLGLFIVALIYLSTQGIININYEVLWRAVSNLFGLAGGAFSWFVHVLSLVPFIGSFIAGFLLGFKLG